MNRAHIRVSSPIALHDGYWVAEAELENPDLAAKVIIINDMHVDAFTGRVTVYAQQRVLGRVLSPPQVEPGEFADLPNGQRVGFHPNAVYLNGSGQELAESDGTGAWWVKHSWELGGEGHFNWELPAQAEYGEGLWVEGNILEDGITMKIGDPEENFGYNLRRPIFMDNSVVYEVVRWSPVNLDPEQGPIDRSFEAKWKINWMHKNEVSAFDGLARSGPEARENK